MRFVTAFGAAAVLIAQTASAQGSMSNVTAVNTKGFFAGAAINGSSIQVDDADFGDSDRENGPGLTLHLGYNFTKNLGIFLSGTAATLSFDSEQVGERDDVTLAHGDLGVRGSFPEAAR
jgi:hypothetical protein